MTKTPSMYADPSNEGYNAIRLGSPSPSTTAPTYNARQRFDGLGGKITVNRNYYPAGFTIERSERGPSE